MIKTNAVFWQNFVNLEDRKLILDKIEKDFDFYEASRYAIRKIKKNLK